jgi:hypothetical protein
VNDGRVGKDRTRVSLVAGGVVVLVGGALACAYAATRPHANDRAAWFTGIAAVVALLGLIAAGAAVYFALPGYRELVNQQSAKADMRLTFQLPDPKDSETWTDVPAESTAQVNTRDFLARVIVHNAGDAVLQWGILNIQVPIACTIQPLDASAHKHHAQSVTPMVSGQLFDGETVPCNATIAERDFPPVHAFIYNVRIAAMGPATVWPIAAVLDGFPGERAWVRINIEMPRG